jgi:hypothetical protein
VLAANAKLTRNVTIIVQEAKTIAKTAITAIASAAKDVVKITGAMMVVQPQAESFSARVVGVSNTVIATAAMRLFAR